MNKTEAKSPDIGDEEKASTVLTPLPAVEGDGGAATRERKAPYRLSSHGAALMPARNSARAASRSHRVRWQT